jgi:hypothetical protein
VTAKNACGNMCTVNASAHFHSCLKPKFRMSAFPFQIKVHLTPLEIMSSLIAAVTHDLDHPGVNQPFLIATSNHLAALYEVKL